EVVVRDAVGVGISGRTPLEGDVGAVRLPAVGREDGGGRGGGRAGNRPLDPFVGEAYPPGPGGLGRVSEAVLPNDHPRQREGCHLEVVDDGQALEPCALRELTPEAVFVAREALDREERIQVLSRLLPRGAVPGEGELRRPALDIEPPAHENVWAAHPPDD